MFVAAVHVAAVLVAAVVGGDDRAGRLWSEVDPFTVRWDAGVVADEQQVPAGRGQVRVAGDVDVEMAGVAFVDREIDESL